MKEKLQITKYHKNKNWNRQTSTVYEYNSLDDMIELSFWHLVTTIEKTGEY